MPPRSSTKRAYSEPPVDPDESGKKRKANTNVAAKDGSPSPSSSSDFSSGETESETPIMSEDYVDYSMMMAQAEQAETYSSRPPRQQRWKHDGDVPITDPALVPEGWNADELDLDVNDINGQVERCMERISDGILPSFFKFRLSEYEKRRAARDEMIHSEPAGLSWDIVQRLDHLKTIETHLNTNGDPDDQLPNVKAIIKAYREGKLGWSRGWVSYWSKGIQLNAPQKFSVEYHKKLAEEYDTTRAWWVEGLQAAGGANVGAFHGFPPTNSLHTIEYPVEITSDSQSTGCYSITLLVCHDTGADVMAIPEYYIDQLERLGTRCPVHGYNIVATPDGMGVHKVVELDVRLNDGSGQTLSYWLRVQACVLVDMPGPNVSMILSGPFVRFALYTATCPDGQGNLYVCNHKRELKHLPAVPHNFVPRGPPYINTAPPLADGGPPSLSTVAQAITAPTVPMRPPPLQPLKKAKAKKGKKKGKNAAAS
ncbi:hypothetical protein N7517_005863 [Penicillium concentricum]|uniref:Uncharacterized protein n=1 Tax=Penicillium concentricum TaxID=293559 RepID=A0A9W9V9K8_9EURO|nr:uncharacterized protein N7517_005863 [Penicillium concentricum]KAJ5373857.1 hypothetical protein N7517_005863 [Penicillium concentricum]